MDRPRDGLGASDAAAILGVSRWHTPLDVWNQKKGITGPEPKKEHQEWGLLLEPALAVRYTQVTGRKVRRVGTVRSRVHPMLYAHPDRVVVGEPGLVEIKVSYRSWGGDIPIYYKTQAIQQLIVTDREWVDFAVLEGGQRFVNPPPRYERDRSIEADFIAELEDWWTRYIVGDEPPPMDGGEAGRQYLMHRHPSGDGEIVATASMLPTVERYQRTIYNRKQVEAEEARIKQEIMALIGDGQALVGPFGRITWTRSEQHKTDWKQVALLYRRILEQLEDQPIEKVRFMMGLNGTPWRQALDDLSGLYQTRVPFSRLTPNFKEADDD